MRARPLRMGLVLSLTWFANLSAASAQALVDQAKLVASDGGDGDQLGEVSLSGNTILVGAPGNALGIGAAYVFVPEGTTWWEEAKLVASDGVEGDFFGRSVSLSGETAIVGAFLADVPTPLGIQHDAGAAYVFVRSGTTWTEEAKLTASDASLNAAFGNSVWISGDTTIVASSSRRLPSSQGQYGAVYVYVRHGTAWTEEATLVASDAADGHLFGHSVALFNDTAIIGRPLSQSGIRAGSAYVFVRNGTAWTEQAKLTSSQPAADDKFGISVALSGDTAAVGAVNPLGQGAAYIWVRSGTTWTEQARLTGNDPSAGERFGQGIGLLDDKIVVGAPLTQFVIEGTPCSFTTREGSAYVFARNNSIWTQETTLRASDPARDGFGERVALSSDRIVIGSPYERCPVTFGMEARGAAHVFEAGPPRPHITEIDPSCFGLLIPGTAHTVQIRGTDFDLITELFLNCTRVDPARYTIVGPSLITIDMPQSDSVWTELSVTDGTAYRSAGACLPRFETLDPVYQLGNGDPYNIVDRDDGLSFVLSGRPETVQYVYVSRSNLPSTNRFVNLQLGNQFTQVIPAGRYEIPEIGWLEIHIPSSALADPGLDGVVFYSQTIEFPYQQPFFPVRVSNLQSITLVR